MKSPTNTSELAQGWQVLIPAIVGVSTGATVVVFNVFGALIIPIAAETGWSHAHVQLGFLVFALAGAGTSLYIGKLVDRYGARRIALCGIPAFGCSLLLLATTPPVLPAYLLLWGLVGMAGAMTTPLTYTAAINPVFVRHRGKALAAILFASGLAAAVVQATSSVLLVHLSWRATLGVFGLSSMGLGLPVVYLLLRGPPSGRSVSPSPGTVSAVRPRVASIRLAIICVAIALMTLAVSGSVINLKAMAVASGRPAGSIAEIGIVFGLTLAIGRLATGALVDRVWAPLVAFATTLPVAAAATLIGLGNNSAAAYLLFAAALGLCGGAETDLAPFLVSRYQPTSIYGASYGIVFATFSVTTGLAPVLFAWSFDLAASYTPALLLASGSSVCGGVLLLCLGAYPRIPSAACPLADH